MVQNQETQTQPLAGRVVLAVELAAEVLQNREELELLDKAMQEEILPLVKIILELAVAEQVQLVQMPELEDLVLVEMAARV
jgi:hypothetical protein